MFQNQHNQKCSKNHHLARDTSYQLKPLKLEPKQPREQLNTTQQIADNTGATRTVREKICSWREQISEHITSYAG